MTVIDSFSTTVADGDQLDDGYFNGNFAPLLCGDGSDGAFSSSSGSTSLTQGTIYQYTSFSLTGTGVITTTKTTGQPIVVLVQGNLTISTSGTCDFKGLGEDSPTTTSFKVLGATGADDNLDTLTAWSNGQAGTSVSDSGDAIGRGGNPPLLSNCKRVYEELGVFNHTLMIVSGTKGGDGVISAAGPTAGTGSSGGGSIVFIVGGTATISGVTFDMRGNAGGDASGGGSNNLAQGGGGGGGGAIGIFCYGTLTDSGTYTVTGGAGGAGVETGTYGGGNFIGSGGGGASCINCGSDGDSSNSDIKSGGAGATGYAIRKQIKW